MRKILILICCFLFFVSIIIPVAFLGYKYYKDMPVSHSDKHGFVNDASHLNEMSVDSIISVKRDSTDAILQLIALIKEAKDNGRKISIAGAQHSMGDILFTKAACF
ncbi:hypothetical protein [Niabella ginsengisoli]|nr:hypothetical protein [Niabella ginsengisoli]MCH5596419.1 hypothetical protein [Niabella ginsengisoli]